VLPKHLQKELGIDKRCPQGSRVHASVRGDLQPCETMLSGPEEKSRFQVVRKGMQNVEGAGLAEDGYHAWVEVHHLLKEPDLMPNCRHILDHFRLASEGSWCNFHDEERLIAFV
jgi:predicted TIM-barrel fold metal-dependent hydrolase